MIPQKEVVCKKSTSSKEVETTRKTSKSPENQGYFLRVWIPFQAVEASGGSLLDMFFPVG